MSTLLTLLRRLPVYVYVVAAAIAILGTALGLFIHYERGIGARDIQNVSLKHTDASLEKKIAAESIVVVHMDTVKVFRKVFLTDTVLQNLIDQRTDTVYVTRDVLIETKATLDKAKDVADACCSLARTRAARIAVLDSLNANLEKQIPSKAKPWFDRAIGAGVCAGAVWLGRR